MTSGRPGEERLVVVSPTVVAKVRPEKSTGPERELEILRGIGASARIAGTRVPEPLLLQALPGRSALIETALPGQPAAVLLAARPGAFARILTLVVDWLEAWQHASAVRRRPMAEELERHVLDLAERVARPLDGGAPYLSWLAGRCRAVAANPIPFVAAHNDLTMFNVLVDGNRIGVVDWEAASDAQLPFGDFAYAAADAAAAAGRYRDRAAAFEACFRRDGRHAARVSSLRGRIMTAVGASAELAELSFHACWLQHAADEERKEPRSPNRPFLAIVERLVQAPQAWKPV